MYDRSVAALELAIGDDLLRVDDGVLELFRQSFDRSLRVPIAWVGVEIDEGKHGSVVLCVGTANPIGPVLYGPSVRVLGNYWPLETTVGDEPRYRAFFGQVAALAGRSIEP